MPALLQVMALAAMAFLASALLGRDQRRAGASSFYVLAGVLVGPVGIGLLDEPSQGLLPPLVSLSVTWMGWLRGMSLFDPRLRRPGRRAGLAALLEAGAVVVVVTFGLHGVAPAFGASLPLTSSAAIGIALAGSSLFAADLLRGRSAESGSAFRFLETVSSLDSLVPILGLLALQFALPAPRLAVPLASMIWAPTACVIGLGLTIGLIFLLAAGRRVPLERGWLILLGAAFLAAGVADQLGIPGVIVGFVAGAVTTRSAGGRRISDVVASSERPVALLIAVLVGTRVGLDQTLLLLGLLAVVLWGASRVAVARLLRMLGPPGEVRGLAFLGYGGFPLAVAAQIDLTYGGWLGALALTSAAGLCLVSDGLGALRLYRAFRTPGELLPAEPAGG